METTRERLPLLLGLDVGTQSLRAALVDVHGRTVAFGVAPIETTYPRPGWAEQSPGNGGPAPRKPFAALWPRGKSTPSESSRSVSTARRAPSWPADARDGRCALPSCGWISAPFERPPRSARPATRSCGTSRAASRPNGCSPRPSGSSGTSPDNYERADRIVECTDWMMFQLTGEWTLSLNHVAVKWNYARPEGGWPIGLLERIGLTDLLRKWPVRIVPLGRQGGKLSDRAARDLGLAPGIPVAQGGIDAYLGMLGLGATQDGDVAVIVGSSTCHLAQSREGVFGSGAAGCYPDATVEGLYTLEAGQTATGSILDWYRRHFAGSQQAEAERRGVHVFQVLDEQAAAVPPGAEGLVVRDDWQGNRSPYKNPAARGAITGLSLAHGPGHVVRAIYEATAWARGTSSRMPRSMVSRSSGSSWAAAAPGRRSGCRFTPTSSRSRSTWPARAKSARSARPWPRPSPPASIPTSPRPPGRWSPSRPW